MLQVNRIYFGVYINPTKVVFWRLCRLGFFHVGFSPTLQKMFLLLISCLCPNLHKTDFIVLKFAKLNSAKLAITGDLQD